MFTGIVTAKGRIAGIEHAGDDGADRMFRIEAPFDTSVVEIGASIACAGVCLTVIQTGAGWFEVQVSNETVGRTTIGAWSADTAINLERALRVGDELGGHIVSGHVNGVGEVLSVEPDGGSHRFRIRAPETLKRMIAGKGSIAVEGVSLTVNEVDDEIFGVNVIPHTMSATTLGDLRPGARVNLEVDMLARYVARLLGKE